jgi:two-component system KDP operon response regulator KdpE
VDGKPVRLTSTESKLLYYLVRNEGRLLSHENLLTKVWGESYIDARALLRVHIQHLRRKLGDNAESPSIIVTEHGMGYKFVPPTHLQIGCGYTRIANGRQFQEMPGLRPLPRLSAPRRR